MSSPSKGGYGLGYGRRKRSATANDDTESANNDNAVSAEPSEVDSLKRRIHELEEELVPRFMHLQNGIFTGTVNGLLAPPAWLEVNNF